MTHEERHGERVRDRDTHNSIPSVQSLTSKSSTWWEVLVGSSLSTSTLCFPKSKDCCVLWSSSMKWKTNQIIEKQWIQKTYYTQNGNISILPCLHNQIKVN